MLETMNEKTETVFASDVVIVGGGIGGVASALALRQLGAHVTLVERAPEFGEVGAGLQMAPNATRILKKWGLLDEVLSIGVKPAGIVFRDARTGEELTRQHTGEEFEARYGAPYIVAHRSDLHRILVDAARQAGVELLNGVFIERVETVNQRARAIAADGRIFEADVVLGADGLESTLRSQVSNDDSVGSHFVAYRGALPMSDVVHKADLEDVVVWFGHNCHLVQYPLRKGEILNTVAVFKSPSFERGEENFGGPEELEEAYKDCVPEVREALDNLWKNVRWPMYDREPIDNWIDGRLVLTGDAAHPMLQYLAQGACQAIEDADVMQSLARGTVFTDDGIKPEAWDGVLKAFNDARAPRTARVQRTARVWGESWHVGEGIAHTLRNMLFKARTDSDTEYTDWLYGDGS